MTAQPDAPPRRVLVALDGSTAAATALPLARTVAGQLGATLAVLHVTPGPPLAPALWQRLHADLAAGETVEIRSPVPEPAAEILAAARDPGVVLVVLTTHGRAVEPGRHLGSVAEAVIARTLPPVLLVRPEAADRPPVPPLHHLLLPLDGTPTTAVALRPATELAGQLGAALDLLHVAGPGQALPDERGSISAPRYVDQPQHEWPQWAGEVIERLCRCLAQCPPDVPVQMHLLHGDIGAEIARFAAERAVDAIVLVRRSQLEPGRAGILRAVLDRTPCPVLLVGTPSAPSGPAALQLDRLAPASGGPT
jgi:nucleotide-binding universal stress UspA family protein